MSIAPVERPVASATNGFVRFIGGGLAPYVVAKLEEHTNVQVPFLIGAATIIAAALVLANLRPALDAADRGEVVQPELNEPSSSAASRWAPAEPRENQELRPDMSPAVCSYLDTIEFTAIPDPVVGCEGMPEDRLALGASADVNGLRQGRLLRRLAQPAPVEARALGLASQHQVG